MIIMYMEITSGFAMSKRELLDIWYTEYDGGDDTNAVTFDEFLQGVMYEEMNGGLFPCYFEEVAI